MSAEYIVYSDGLITKCEKALGKYWRKVGLKLTRRPKAALGPFYCEVDPARNNGVLQEEKSNAVMPLPVLPIHPFSPPGTFYFGVRLRFDHQYDSKYALTSASVHVFAGAELYPIVRAEWDRRDVGNSVHAQPHWHLLAGPGLQPETSGVAATAFTPQSETDHLEVERIHFPLSASWHQDGVAASCQHPFVNDQHLLKWIDGLTGYLGEQLVYVNAKTGSTSNTDPPTMDFSPSAS